MKTIKIKPAFAEGEPPEPPSEERMEVPAGGIIMYVNSDTPVGFAKVEGLHFVEVSSSTTVNKTPTADELSGHGHTYPASSTAGVHTHYTSGETDGSPTTQYHMYGPNMDSHASGGHWHQASEQNTSQNKGHSHPGGTLAAAGAVIPPYRVLNFIKNVTAGLAVAPVGSIVMVGVGVTVPNGWAICNGSNGTVDMRERFAYGATGNANLLGIGGSKTHTHGSGTTAAAGNHSHTYSVSIGSGGGDVWIAATDSQGVGMSKTPHTHTVGTLTTPTQAAHVHTYPQSEAVDHMPPYLYLYYIQRVT